MAPAGGIVHLDAGLRKGIAVCELVIPVEALATDEEILVEGVQSHVLRGDAYGRCVNDSPILFKVREVIPQGR